jgi:hypothetical protein
MQRRSLSALIPTSTIAPVLTAALAIAIFVMDTVTDLEIAVAVFYVAVVLISVSFCQKRGVVRVGAACMALTLLSYFLTATGSPRAGFINCAIGLSAIGATTYLALRIKAAEGAMREARMQLAHNARVTNVLSGLMETVAGEPYRGQADLPALATSLQMEIDDLFPVAETLQLLRFAEVAEGDIRLTDAAKRFVQADVDARKKLFAQHVLNYVPLAGHIKHVLDERSTHRAPASRFRDELEDHMSEQDAEQTLRAVISFARYGEAFAYDESSGVFSLENPA